MTRWYIIQIPFCPQKTISNYNRSPHMGDTVEFTIDMISVEKIGLLKMKIKEYFEGARQYWHEKHRVAVTGMENASKLKMVLHFKHTMNFQEFGEKNVRRAELIMALMKILEEQKIIYYLLTQEVHLAQTKSDASVDTSDANVVM
ncbi:hypothetical protein M0R45_000946 [Rubus argutus]|uniref:Uncharacterized protein n=1 Tax=Rubus argutus TaxID=59490 RepID=A0AAW1VKE9_RUBAR